MAKIIKTEENLIEFADGTKITCDHCPDCCEHNYADCGQIDDLARGYDFNTAELKIEAVDGSGFRFGDNPNRMFFVPCYSSQNGYYSSDLDVYINGEHWVNLECEEDFY